MSLFISGGDPKLWHIGNDQSVIKKVVPKEVDIPVTYPCMHCANWFLMYLREYVMAFSKKVMYILSIQVFRVHKVAEFILFYIHQLQIIKQS